MTHPRTEHLLYLLAFLLALGLRLAALGNAPLSDFEAAWAIQSLELARGTSLIPGALPGYLLPTAFLFSIFQDANFTARLLPALAGSLLVLSPYAFRRHLGRTAALILAFGLAIDPGMVTLSRMIGSPMMAAAFLVLAWALLMPGGRRETGDGRQEHPPSAARYALGGIAAGMALLSGPAVITGALGLGIAYGLARLTGVLPGRGTASEAESDPKPARWSLTEWRIALGFGVGTVLLVGTLFFLYPQGLAGWASTLDAYITLWQQRSDVPAGRLLAAVFFYALLPLVFGLAGAVRGWVQRRDPERALSFWLLAALILPLLMPGHQVGDVIWALLPLWALAALELARFARAGERPLAAAGLAAGILVLLVIIWLTLAALDTAIPENVPRYQVVLAASVVIGALGVLLVAVSWSLSAAWDGLVWGTAAGLLLYTLSATFSASQVHANTPQSWWWIAPTPSHVTLARETLDDLGLMSSGRANSLELVSLVDTPSVRWMLRNTEGVTYAPSMEPDSTPAVAITHLDDPLPPGWEQLYRGQDFGWAEFPAWETALPPDTLNWLFNYNVPTSTASIVIWARLDLFPADMTAPSPAPAEPNAEESLPAP